MSENKSVIDEAGEAILRSISNADRFNQWMFDTIKPWCKGEILEIGSGIGNISQCFLNNGFDIFMTDLRSHYCKALHQKFGSHDHLSGISTLNVVDENFDKVYHKFNNRFDTVVALNVVEHIKLDALAIANCRKMLKDYGRIVLLVPAHMYLYNQLDEELGHYKRYQKEALYKLVSQTGFSIIHTQYFNAPGILAWWISSLNKKQRTITHTQMKIYNQLVPLFRNIDRLIQHSYGLSLILVGEKI